MTAVRVTMPLQADMTTPFADGLLQSTSGVVADLALILLGTLAHCLTNEAAVNCFQQVARSVCFWARRVCEGIRCASTGS
jgi:hypothetical protein